MSDLERNDSYRENGAATYDFAKTESPDETLQRIRTAGTLSISPELFEKLYLTPKTPNKGNLRMTIGNPSPL